MSQRGSASTAHTGCGCPGILRRVFGCRAAADHCPCRCQGPQPAEAERELDERFELLKFSYEEVLDATKHQDDKINRLLTTVAFITAAALALTTLGHDSAPITATFLVDGRYHLPLGIIGLAGFVAGVTISVIMLIASMTTPLVLPGRTNPVTPDVRYVSKPEVPQFYFNEISGTALPGWYRKWQHSVVELKLERNDSLVRETHNLAVRTQYKYQRSNEAVAVLSFALLSFVLSATLILIAAAREPANPATDVVAPSLGLNITVRGVLAAIFFGYCVLQLLATQRNRPPTVLDIAYPARTLGVSIRVWSHCYVVVGALIAPQLVLLPAEPAAIRVLLAVAVPILAWLVLGLALPWYSETAERVQREVALQVLRDSEVLPNPEVVLPARTTEEAIKDHNGNVRWSWLTTLIFAVGYAAFGLLTALSSAYREVLGLAGAYGFGLLLTASAIWQLARRTTRRAHGFRKFVKDEKEKDEKEKAEKEKAEKG